MSRLPEFDEARFDARQKTIYDEIIAARGHLGGPFKIWIYSPELADRNQRLGIFLRYQTSLEPRLSELAILVVGRHFDCQVECTLHEGFAREAGLEDEIIDALRNRQKPTDLGPAENAVYAYTTELLARGRVGDRTFATAHSAVGDQGVVELTSLIGHYVHVSMTLNAFEVPLPPDVEPTLTDMPLH